MGDTWGEGKYSRERMEVWVIAVKFVLQLQSDAFWGMMRVSLMILSHFPACLWYGRGEGAPSQREIYTLSLGRKWGQGRAFPGSPVFQLPSAQNNPDAKGTYSGMV